MTIIVCSGMHNWMHYLKTSKWMKICRPVFWLRWNEKASWNSIRTIRWLLMLIMICLWKLSPQWQHNLEKNVNYYMRITMWITFCWRRHPTSWLNNYYFYYDKNEQNYFSSNLYQNLIYSKVGHNKDERGSVHCALLAVNVP